MRRVYQAVREEDGFFWPIEEALPVESFTGFYSASESNWLCAL